jgi:phosphohistidine phosphatase
MSDDTLRRLIILRHAKSSWPDSPIDDRERALSERGRRDAPRVGARLAEAGWVPEVVLSSDARRTHETWELVRDELGGAPRVEWWQTLYHTGIDAFQLAVGGIESEAHTVMLIGHNPGCEEAVEWLTGQQVRITTGNAVLLEKRSASWRRAITSRAEWHLVEVIRPREID